MFGCSRIAKHSHMELLAITTGFHPGVLNYTTMHLVAGRGVAPRPNSAYEAGVVALLTRNCSFLVGPVGFEPTVGFLRSIMSRVPATNTASDPSSLYYKPKGRRI